MTTTVTVTAAHGHPVRVTNIQGGSQAVSTIEANARREFYIWAGMDVRLHEVQPDEAPTYGERAVGASFNPSNDPCVDRLKAIFAEAIDICDALRQKPSASPELKRLASIAITQAQDAQMWAVKAQTWVG